METKNFAIAKTVDGQRWYWTGPVKCWHVDTPEEYELLSISYARKELERLKVSLPQIADRLMIIDVIAYKAKCAVYGKAFREFMVGKDKTKENLAAARTVASAAYDDAFRGFMVG